MDEFLNLTTTDNSNVYIKKESIDAIEEIVGSARTDTYIKIYVKGYHFKLKMNLNDIKLLLKFK